TIAAMFDFRGGIRQIMFGEPKGEGYDRIRHSSSDCSRLTSAISTSSFATTFAGSWRAGMPSIRDLVAAIRQRDGVDAAIVLGRDGLLIDSQLGPGLDPEDAAARIPAIIGPADELGTSTGRGELLTAVLEYRGGLAIVSVLSTEA